MTDQTSNPLEPAPPLAPPDEPSDEIKKAAHKNAEYFARNPAVLDATLDFLEKAGVVHANQRIDQLQRELTVRDALADHGLTRTDAAFITGTTPEQINASATAFKARLDSVAVKADPEGSGNPPKETPKPKVTPAADVPPLPDHRGNRTSLEVAEQNLLDSSQDFCANFDLSTMGRS